MNRILDGVGHTLNDDGGVTSPVFVEPLRYLNHVTGLRPFWALDNLKLNRIPFVQSFVALAYDCRIMNEHIWTVIAPDETEALCVIEPFDLTSHSSFLSRGHSLVSVAG